MKTFTSMALAILTLWLAMAAAATTCPPVESEDLDKAKYFSGLWYFTHVGPDSGSASLPSMHQNCSSYKGKTDGDGYKEAFVTYNPSSGKFTYDVSFGKFSSGSKGKYDVDNLLVNKDGTRADQTTYKYVATVVKLDGDSALMNICLQMSNSYFAYNVFVNRKKDQEPSASVKGALKGPQFSAFTPVSGLSCKYEDDVLDTLLAKVNK